MTIYFETLGNYGYIKIRDIMFKRYDTYSLKDIVENMNEQGLSHFLGSISDASYWFAISKGQFSIQELSDIIECVSTSKNKKASKILPKLFSVYDGIRYIQE